MIVIVLVIIIIIHDLTGSRFSANVRLSSLATCKVGKRRLSLESLPAQPSRCCVLHLARPLDAAAAVAEARDASQLPVAKHHTSARPQIC